MAESDPTRAAAGPWVGRSILRFEDDALLRGEGRFLDDLVPVAHRYHAAVVRSQLAHARIEVDTSAALAQPGVVGVLTGADVAALSRPFPAGIETGVPQYAAALDTVRYVGEPIAVVVARDRYLAEDAAELVEVDYDPLDPVLDPVAAASDPVHERVVPSTATSRKRSPGPTSSSARRSTSRASRARRSSATRSSPTGTRPPGASRPGRTSRARSRCTASPRPRSASAATGCGS